MLFSYTPSLGQFTLKCYKDRFWVGYRAPSNHGNRVGVTFNGVFLNGLGSLARVTSLLLCGLTLSS